MASDQPTQQTGEPTATHDAYLKKIARNAGIAGGGNIFSQVMGPIIGVITTRALGAELYGFYTLATYWTGILAEISQLGFSGTLVRFVATYKGEGRQDKIRGAILLTTKIGLSLGLLFTILLYLFADEFSRTLLHNQAAAPYLRFFAPAIVLTVAYSIPIAALTGFQEQRYVVFTGAVLGNVVKLASLVILLLFGFTIDAALGSSLIQDGIMAVAGAWFLYKVFPILKNTLAATVTETKKLWQFSGTIFATGLFNKYTFQLDILFLGFYAPTSQVGLYAVALKLQPVVYLTHYAFSQIFSPMIAEIYARKETRQLEDLYRVVTRWILAISTPIFMSVIFFYKPILGIFGKDFQGAALALILLSIGNFFADIFGLSGQVILMIGRPMINLVNSIITAVVSITLFLLLIPKYGIDGAAASYTVSLIMVYTIRQVQVYRFVGIHPFSVRQLKVVAAAAITALAVFGVKSLAIYTEYAQAWIVVAAGMWGLYLFLLWAFRLDASDRLILDALKNKLIRRGKG